MQISRLKNSLVWKLTVWFLLLSLLPLAVMSIFVRQTVSDTFDELAADETLSQARLLAHEISTFIDANQVQTILANSGGETRLAFLVGDTGRYTAHSDDDKVGGSVLNDFSAEVAEKLVVGGEGTLIDPATGDLISYVSVTAAFSTAVLIVDAAVVSAPMHRIERTAFFQLAVSLALIVAAGSVAIWFVFKPIQRLTKAAEEVGAGNLDVRIDPSGMEGELEVLTLAFNQMTGQLQEAHDDLDQRVEERTEELRRIQEAERRLAEETTLLSQVGQIVSSTLDIDEVYERFAAQMKKLVDFDRLAINIVDQDAGVFVFRYASGLVQPGRQVPDVVALPNTQTEHVIATGQALIRGDIVSDRQFARDSLSVELGFRSTIMVPLFHKGRILGTLSLRSLRVNAYGSREQSILERLSDYIAPAIENSELYFQKTKAEEALRDSEERFRALFEDSRDPIFISHIGKIIAANQAAMEAFGFSQEEAIGSDVGERFVEPADRERFRQEIDLIGYVIDFEVKLRRHDGTVLDCLLTASSRHASNGVASGEIQGIVRDISDRKIAEEMQLQQTRELAVLEERNRMAREIHDTLAQGFTGIVLQLEAGEQAMDTSPAEVIDHLQRAKNLARESLQEARRTVWDLLPRALEGFSLEEALQEEVSRFDSEGHEKASFRLSGNARELSSDVRTALLRTCQESLTNIKKHAGATEVSVTLTYRPDSVDLDVRDNGNGFDADGPVGTTGNGGFGLIGMEQRARILGGSLSVSSHRGKGTHVAVTIPRAES